MKKKIFIVDDEMMIREMYKDLFENSGYEVDLAANGKEALEKMDEKSYDMILLDIMMPVMDGMTMLSNINKDTPQKKQGSLMVLTNASPSMFEEIKEKYAKNQKQRTGLQLVDCVVKSSISPDELVEKIDKCVK
ncbi:MAG: response regulator [Candidatus Moranbacteria bacterium]|nr:response regulator [Candidatus Moranbacteria bacterium]